MLDPRELDFTVDTCQQAYITALAWAREVQGEPEPATAAA
jgi:hypothetical protein